MAVFKPTNQVQKTTKAFKPTKYAGYSNSTVYGWQSQNKSALDILNEYQSKISKGEWLSEEDRARYSSAIDTYTSTGNSLRDASKFYGTKYTDDEEKSWQDSLSSLKQGYTSVNDFYNQFADDREYGVWKDRENKRQEFSSISSLHDYEKYSTEGQKMNVVPNLNKVLSNAFEYGDYKEKQGLMEKYMTEDEWGIYNYYLGKGDTGKANEYLAFLDSDLKQRAAGKTFAKYDNTALELLFSAGAGLDQFTTGLRNVGNMVYGNEPVSSPTTQYVASTMGKNNTGVWKVANDLTQTLANQLPSIGVGMLTGGTMGGVTMGMSAAGNSYGDMIREGYGTNQARAYGVMTGASEFALSKVLGGISSLGGNGNGVFQSISSKVLPGVNNAIGRMAIQLGGNVLDEALEEGVQTALEPVFKWAATLGETEFEKINWEEVGYSALLGGLSAGLLEGAPSVYKGVSINQAAQKAYGNQAPDVVAQALELNSNDKLAQMAQSRLNKGKNVSGLVLNDLAQNIEQGYTKQDSTKIKSAVETRLQGLGENGDVSSLANAIAKQIVGEKLNFGESKLIKNSQYAQRVLNELNPQNIEQGTHTSAWAEGIGTKRVNADAYNRRASVQVKTNDGKNTTIGEVKSIDGDVATVELEDGTIAKVGLDKNANTDLKFDNPKMESVFKIATEKVGRVEGWTTETANAMIKAYELNNTLGVEAFARGWSEAYNIGRNNNSVAQLNHSSFAMNLSDETRMNAYNIGKALAMPSKNVATEQEYKVSFDSTVDETKLTNKQKDQIKALDIVSKALGVNVKVFDSPVNAKGERIGKNGSYNPTTRTIEVDLHAGTDGRGVMLFTASHELTHHMKEVARDKFNSYAEAVFEALGEDADALVENKLESLRRNGHLEGKTEEEAYDLAFEEVVADSAERMLVDTDALARLSESLKGKDKTLWEKVKDFFTSLIEKIKKAYEELSPDSIEAQRLSEISDELEKIQKLWVEGIVEASKTGDTVSTDAETTHTQAKDVKYSDRDSIYLDAVNRGDMETAQRMVDEAAKKAGYNYHLYHGTDAYFTEFDLRKHGGENGKGEGYGIYLAANKEISAPYGKNVIDSYTRFNRLAEGREKTLSYDEVRNLIKRSCELEAKQMVNDEGYDSVSEALKDTWVSNVVYTYGYSNMEQIYNDVANKLWKENDNDGDLVNEMMALSGANYDYNNALKFYEDVLTPTTGIDGFHYIWGNKDGSGVQNDIYLAFNSNQIKSADPVTYDDDGNVIPLSERFKAENNDIRYSFRNSSSGMANDGLSPYNAELTKFIEQNNGYIVDSFDKLEQLVNLAFDEPDAKGTAYFGIINPTILEKIKNSIPNLPQATRDVLFKKGKDYSIATTLDSIRHIVDEKKLSRTDVIDYLDRLADTIVEFDTVTFDYYHQGASKTAGLLFKKQFNDGTLVSFALVSHKKRSLVLQSLYLNSADYKKKKAAETLLMQNASAHTSKTQVGQPSTNSISQKSDLSTRNQKNSDRLSPEESFSNRSLLANALESAIQSDVEYKKLDDYKAVLGYLKAEEIKLAELQRQIYDMTFGNGERDAKKLKELQEEKRKTESRIDFHDKKLLQLEATKALTNVLERAKKQAYQSAMEKGRELMHRNVEGRHKTIEREKIKKVAKELDKLLSRGNKKKNVKVGAQGIVRAALDLSNMYFATDDEIVTSGIITEATESENLALAKYRKLYEEYHSFDNDVTNHKDERANLRKEMSEVKKDFAELLERERQRISKLKAKESINTLANAYAELKNADEDYLNGAYRQEVAERLSSLAEDLGDTLVADMTLEQLEALYKAFSMIKHLVQTSNQMFRDGKKEEMSVRVNAIFSEINKLKNASDKDYIEWYGKARNAFDKFGWKNLRPVDAFEVIGSTHLEDLYWDVIKAQDVYANDIEEAKSAIINARKTHGYQKWDMDITNTFKSIDGREFKLTLGEMMSLYAYSKRTQADKHLREGGFQYEKEATYKDKKGVRRLHKNEAYTYKVSDDLMISIINSLTKVQKAYVEEVQKLLTSWGEKGNEASRILYGIDLFNEEVYFPLRSSKDYLSSVDTEMGKTMTTASLSNSGFTKATTPKANNPIILRAFDDVVLEHLDKMSKYHAYVIPIDNLRKVLDAKATDSLDNQLALKSLIRSKHGDGAESYLQTFITDLNGGAMSQPAPLEEWIGKAKAVQVMANLSVWVQQYFSVIRATSEVDPKYFVPFLGESYRKEDMKLYNEMKRYAPITVIKEMGGFDVGSNRGAKEYFGYEETKRTRSKTEKQVQDALGVGATMMDKLGWMTIWKAVKKEVAATNKYKPNSEEYYKACGERFERVIAKTQVYDSVNARSGHMRSKNVLTKMMTSFMGEPTVIVGMAYSSIVNYTRAVNSGDKAQIKKATVRLTSTAISLTLATAMTSVAKSLIYAMRDDDEDETFLEKYASALGGAFRDDLNLLNYAPVFRDISSVINGFTIERPDMSLLEDLIFTIKKIADEEEDEDKVDEWINFAGAAANLLRFPLKNIIRDIKALSNTVTGLGKDFDTDFGAEFYEGLSNKERTKSENLYNAVIRNDTKRLEYYQSTYKEASGYESALKKALRDNDRRVEEGAKARLNGDKHTYYRLMRDIIDEGNFDRQLVIDAFKAEYNYLKDKLESKKE